MEHHIRFSHKDLALLLLDQRLLPAKEEYFACADSKDVIYALQEMVVRGAPAIGQRRHLGNRLVGFDLQQRLATDIGGAGRNQTGASADDLVIAAPYGGLSVTLKNAGLATGPLAWGSATLRAGEIGFTAHRAADGSLYKVELTADPEA